MTPTLIVLGLLALGVAIVVFATRQRGRGVPQAPIAPETGWDAAFTPVEPPVAEAESIEPELEPAPTEPAMAKDAR